MSISLSSVSTTLNSLISPWTMPNFTIFSYSSKIFPSISSASSSVRSLSLSSASSTPLMYSMTIACLFQAIGFGTFAKGLNNTRASCSFFAINLETYNQLL
ncbi:100aa long hypothetical protein [Pyrococcus horikoshii OT3]|uniref:Uncharacterized protein n=1 Tax=Pyrococcus horikoshii (strain ATCC 700860 / DSM 12428 / JCM 9974 / NBRC 100139 / OT-3) TaxID=70601 RepID=O58249_PYRHO|nr:100aa long hypothetical protein [Pyrococcus horikoshii OT3]